MEWQIRNWLYFTWLSGDHIVEQHVHNLDVVNWAIGAHPIRAMGMGGRQVRTGPNFGQIFDHFAIDYEYPGDVHALSMCRQTDGCANRVAESTLTAIMGRMSAYTGREVTWEQAIGSKLDLTPPGGYVLGDLPVAPVAVPGRTPLV